VRVKHYWERTFSMWNIYFSRQVDALTVAQDNTLVNLGDIWQVLVEMPEVESRACSWNLIMGVVG